MESQHFDELARLLASSASRRRVLKGLAAGLFGSAAGVRRARSVAAAMPCASARDCPTRRCVDGFCCDRPCTGQCEACNVAGQEGVCMPVAGRPVGRRAACPGTGPCQATCDGQNRAACSFPGDQTSCGTPTCTNGFQTTYACGGNGSCVPTTTGCGLFVCNPAGTACLTDCAANFDCVGEAFCGLDGACHGDRGLGEPCVSGVQCQAGYCVDGVCCNAACDGGCEACNLPGNAGFCVPEADGADCAGGTCCDGDCIDLLSDLEHCGACDNACPLVPPGPCADDPICRNGQCAFSPRPQGTPCRPDENLGATCDKDSDCASGRCNPTSGFCCAEACNPNVPCTGPGFTCGCPTDCRELDRDCIVGVCNTATGICEEQPDENNPDCDGENPCSFCMSCQTCRGGTCVDLDEGSPCAVGNECGIVGGECRSGFCIGTIVACPTCQTCRGGQCEPVADATTCDDGDGDACTVGMCQGGVCVSSDVTCPICQTCSGGACVPIEDGTRCDVFSHIVCCGGECVDTHRDPEHCDRCGRSCGADGACVQQDCCPVDRVCTTDPGDDPFRCCREGEICIGGPTAACCAPNGVRCDTTDDCCLFSGTCPPGGGVCGGPGAFCHGTIPCISGRCVDDACE